MIDDDADAALYADSPELLDQDTWRAPVPEVKPKRRAIDTSLRHTYKTIRDAYARRCAAQGLPCAICGKGIDYRLSHGDPWAFELDHVVAVEDDPNLALVETNFQPSHSRCNKRKGTLQAMEREAGGAVGGSGGTSIKWFTRDDGTEYPYEYETDLYGPGSTGPTESW